MIDTSVYGIIDPRHIFEPVFPYSFRAQSEAR